MSDTKIPERVTVDGVEFRMERFGNDRCEVNLCEVGGMVMSGWLVDFPRSGGGRSLGPFDTAEEAVRAAAKAIREEGTFRTPEEAARAMAKTPRKDGAEWD